MTDIAGGTPPIPPTEPTVTTRAVRSALALAARSIAQRLASFICTLVVARHLLPEDYGRFAIAISVVALCSSLADGGITAYFVTRREEPTVGDFHSARSLQVLIVVVILGATIAAAPFLGDLGWLIALCQLKLAIVPVQTVVRVKLQRELEYGHIALSESVFALVSAAMGIVLVYQIGGAESLVASDVIGAWCGLLVLLWRRHRLHSSAAGERPPVFALFRRSMPYQAFTFSLIVRELASVAATSVILGVRILGLVQFALRVLSPVTALFKAMSQLAIPLGSRVVRSEREVRHQVYDGIYVAGLVTATVLAAVVAPAKWLVPLLFGDQWTTAAPLVLAVALSLIVSGPLMSLGLGVLLAARGAALAIKVVAIGCAVLPVAMLVTLPVGGSFPAAVGVVAMSVVEAGVLTWLIRRGIGIDLLLPTLVAPAVFLVSVGVGAYLGTLGGTDLQSSAISMLTSVMIAGLISARLAWRPFASLIRAGRGG